MTDQRDDDQPTEPMPPDTPAPEEASPPSEVPTAEAVEPPPCEAVQADEAGYGGESGDNLPPGGEGGHGLAGMYRDWFLEYASYVILDRAVPALEDGLKPVQRRILHALHEMDDGRFHKVANVIGQTMQYHPHGDAAIYEALVNLGQKGLLLDTQGNWGDPMTGDAAAAARYIEVRLSRFGREVLFEPKITATRPSYDGRRQEPLTLPVRFPLLLDQGVEGIAVGLATKILPHNFGELLDAAVAYLRGLDFQLLPDFPTGGSADTTRYAGGARGGKIRVRAKIEILGKRTLLISEIPFSTTTQSLIDSIVAAHEKRKIKIVKVEDNTAEKVAILVHIAPGVSPERAVDALYAFTDCEIGISPNCCIICGERPVFTEVNQILRWSVDHTVELLRQQLEVRRNELEAQWHAVSLERLFVEKKIYRALEPCPPPEEMLEVVLQKLAPFRKRLRRDLTPEDAEKLIELRIKRISRYDAQRTVDQLGRIETELAGVEHELANLIDHAVAWFAHLREQYGKGRERRTELRSFDSMVAAELAIASERLYVNRQEGFVGTTLRKDEYVCDCSSLDLVIVFRRDGAFLVTAVGDKVFVGQDVLHVAVFPKSGDRTVYHLAYRDGKDGPTRVKRFQVGGVTRDKEYRLFRDKPGSKLLFFSANPNGEGETIRLRLRPAPRLRSTVVDYSFEDLPLRNREAQGVILTKHAISRITSLAKGDSTLAPREVRYEPSIGEFTTDGRGTFLGREDELETILVVLKNGSVVLHQFDLRLKLEEEEVLLILPHDEHTVLTAIHYDGQRDAYFIKRFTVPGKTIRGKRTSLLTDERSGRLIFLCAEPAPRVRLHFDQGMLIPLPDRDLELGQLADIGTLKARGKRLRVPTIASVSLLEPELPPSETIPVMEHEHSDESGASEPSSPPPTAR